MTKPVLEIQNLTKTYHTKGQPPVSAVTDLNLSVHRGEIFGFLGPNGAGKTTTLQCVLGLAPIDAGTIRFFNTTPRSREGLFSRIGYCPDSFSLPGELTPREHLRFFAKLYKIDPGRASDWLARLDLEQYADRPCNALSLGNKQRLLIAQALIHEPELIFFDEPAKGLDPIGLRRIVELFKELSAKGVTIFLNSHQLDQIERLCDRVGILIKGRLQRVDPLAALNETGGLEKYFIDQVEKGGTQ